MGHSGLGDLEQLVLLSVVRLHGAAYAVSVRREIAERTGREIARGAVYVTLDRMERKGYLRSKMSDPTPERGGKAKRMFAMTAKGSRALEHSLRSVGAMLDGLDDRFAWGRR